MIMRFFETRNYQSLEQTVQSWIDCKDRSQQEIVLSEMVARLQLRDRFREPIPLDEHGVPVDKQETTRHDLSLVPGRAAWVIERMLQVKLPRTDQKPSPKMWALLEYLATFHTMEWQTEQAQPPQTEKLSVEERIRLASDTKNTPTRVLAWLGLDPDPRVRRIVAARHSTPPFVRQYLREFDDDEEVRKAAALNWSAGGRPTWDK
ncbi:MAG: hypothetical protein N3A53_01555 [Verrucomicrobiae bacterium]|nr:hypothetical protein [Verrucomicrobiae bacterium]